MRNTICTLVVRLGLGLGALAAGAAGCHSGDAMQAADGGNNNPDDGSASGGGDLAGADLAGSAANPDLAGSSNPEADPKLQGITALHNQARASVNPKPATPIPALVWDTTVAAAAQAVVNTCMFQHSGNGYGENIYASSGTATPAAVVNDWMSEAANYNYANNTCSSTCGHYTQVVWRSSQKLGCAEKTCTTGSPFGSGSWQFWVCDYDPQGNFAGQRPY
jgi:hypothetical protein